MIVALMLACRSVPHADVDCSDGPLTVTLNARLPVCSTLLAQPGPVAAEVRRIQGAGGAWAANGVPLTVWASWWTDSLRWVAPGQCADDEPAAVALVTDGADMTRPAAPYEDGRWFTFVDADGVGWRVADCSTVADHLDPATLTPDNPSTPVAVFRFSRVLDQSEAIQLALEVEAHRWSDSATPDEELTMVAVGADAVDRDPALVTCVAGELDGQSALHERRWTYRDDALWLDETAWALPSCGD